MKDAQPNPENVVRWTAPSNTQYGFTVTLRKIETGTDRLRLLVELDNDGSETVYFYDVNTEIFHGGRRYEPLRTWRSIGELPSRLPPGTRVEGDITFPAIDPGDEDLIIRFQRPTNEKNDREWDDIEFRPAWSSVETDEGGIRELPIAASHTDSRDWRIAIVKADDLREPSANWDRFIEVSARKRVKISIGIICDSLLEDRQSYFEWLRERQESGAVEFWNHGWDHKRWKEGARTISEYGGSGYAYQKEHLTDSQEIMRRVLGAAPVAFGTPWNDFDRDTVRVVNEDRTVRLFFGHKEDIFNDAVVVRMFQAEADGTGKPNFAKFKALYERSKDGIGTIALQFHPNVFEDHHFAEYKRMLDLLLKDGWTFMQPREYLAWLNGCGDHGGNLRPGIPGILVTSGGAVNPGDAL